MDAVIGPVLGSILAIAASQGRVWSRGSLLAVYSLGLGVPFLITGMAMNRLTRTFGWARAPPARHLGGVRYLARRTRRPIGLQTG